MPVWEWQKIQILLRSQAKARLPPFIMTHFQLTWGTGKTEIIKSHYSDFRQAFKEAGYGPEALKMLKSHDEVTATDAETIAYIAMTGQVSNSAPKWENISSEGREKWRSQATQHKYRNSNLMPDRFPRIK